MTTLAAHDPPITSVLTGDRASAGADTPLRGILPPLTRAGKRLFWPLADQGVVSLGNILTILLVGRGIALADFGTFTLILEAMFFLISMHTGLISYPLTIQGAVADEPTLRHLASASVVLTFLLAIPVSIAAFVIADFYHMPAVGLIKGDITLYMPLHAC